jgi:hypothetical protein
LLDFSIANILECLASFFGNSAFCGNCFAYLVFIQSSSAFTTLSTIVRDFHRIFSGVYCQLVRRKVFTTSDDLVPLTRLMLF